MNDSLERIVAELRETWPGISMPWRELLNEWADRLEKLSAASVQVTRDAERYRWLRKHGLVKSWEPWVDNNIQMEQGEDHGR